jgi:hypothetical protein
VNTHIDDGFHLLQDAIEKFRAGGREDLADRVADLIDRQEVYHIAFVNGGTGDFEIVETFYASGDELANQYAEEEYENQDWYVLDRNHKNINGGLQ